MKQPVRSPGNALATFRIFEPHPGVFAYYDGRTGERFHSEKPNWLDDGAFTLGVATYSIVSGNEALLYDAAITADHAAAMLDHVKSLGVTKMTLVYSHFHKDHIAGATALAGCTVVGHKLTAATLRRTEAALSAEDPPVTVVMPTTLYDAEMVVSIGTRMVELHHFNIHTPDGTVLFLPQEGLMFAGDTLEDTATFIADPESLPIHLKELRRMAQLPISKILPAHGSPDRIADGGYDPTFIGATMRYIEAVTEDTEQPAAWTQSLAQVVAQDVAAGTLIYFETYEAVHKSNVKSLQAFRGGVA